MTIRILHKPDNFVQWLMGNQDQPFVYEAEGVKSMRFCCTAVQSSMRLSHPFELELGYTQAMMGFMLFNDEPEHILIVGLGGGSLSKYCYRQFPHARITTLEISPKVIALRDEFMIPPDDERFRVIHADAAAYLANNNVQADIILLDGFDGDGLPDGLSSISFYANCWRNLRSQGVLVSNLLGSSRCVGVCLNRLRGVFNDLLWSSKSFDSSNLIAFAVKSERYAPHWSGLSTKANVLADRYQLNMPWIVKNMRRRQPSI